MVRTNDSRWTAIILHWYSHNSAFLEEGPLAHLMESCVNLTSWNKWANLQKMREHEDDVVYIVVVSTLSGETIGPLK